MSGSPGHGPNRSSASGSEWGAVDPGLPVPRPEEPLPLPVATFRFPGRGFISSPAVALTPDGATLHTFGIGRDLRAYTLRTALNGSDFKGSWSRRGPNNGFS
jgi:hypothetical protein